jgi:hypothetical protein
VSLRDADTCQWLLLVSHLRDLEFEPHYDLGDDAKVLETVGKLRNLRTLRITFCYWTSVRLVLITVVKY